MTRLTGIGGFIGAEDLLPSPTTPYHSSALLLTSGRSCLLAILRYKKPTKVYIPYYICDAVVKTLQENNFTYTYYALNEKMLPQAFPVLQANELILYVDYWGVNTEHVFLMSKRYQHQLIVDATQSFFLKFEDIQNKGYLFNSVRKFFGAPDGAYVYGLAMDSPNALNMDLITEHLFLRKKGRSEAYAFFLQNEAKISSQYLRASSFTKDLLYSLDYEKISTRRKDNFKVYQKLLSARNAFQWPKSLAYAPLCYPFLVKSNADVLRNKLLNENIFLPVYWQECMSRDPLATKFVFEKKITQFLLPLPLDQRYGSQECEWISKIILESYDD